RAQPPGPAAEAAGVIEGEIEWREGHLAARAERRLAAPVELAGRIIAEEAHGQVQPLLADQSAAALVGVLQRDRLRRDLLPQRIVGPQGKEQTRHPASMPGGPSRSGYCLAERFFGHRFHR